MENNPSFDPVIVLAAGKGSRIGRSKGLLEHSGRTCLDWQLSRLEAVGITTAVLVLGYESETYFKRHPFLSHGKYSSKLTIYPVINQDPERGPFSSLQLGVERLSTLSPHGSFVLPVDVPCPEKSVWQLLQNSPHLMVSIPSYRGRGGHPVWLSEDFLQSLLLISPTDPDGRLDRQIARLPTDTVRQLAVDDKRIRMNVNTAESWDECARFFMAE